MAKSAKRKRDNAVTTALDRSAKSLPNRSARVTHSDVARMLWIGTAVTLVAGMVALTLVILAKRPADVDTLGSVSDHWIAEHRVDSL